MPIDEVTKPQEPSTIEPHLPLTLKDETETKIVLEQYKLLVESINNSNQVRENSNHFWMAVNGAGLAGISYIKEAQTLAYHHKPYLLWTMTVIGIILCTSWLTFLATIRRTIGIRNEMLVQLEHYLPVKVFTHTFEVSEKDKGKSSLTLKEMLVPSLFLAGYIFFGILLYWFTEEIIVPARP